MPRQKEPRFGCTGLVGYQQGNVLWGVAWGVENLDVYVSKVKHFSVMRPAKCIQGVGALVEHVFRPRKFREFSPAGYVIRVQVSINHVPDVQTVFLGQTDVELGIVDGVAHGAQGSTTSTENVGSSGWGLLMKQLTENHLNLNSAKSEKDLL